MIRKERSASRQKYVYLTHSQLSPKVPLHYLKHARHNSDDKLIRRESTSSKYTRQRPDKHYSQVTAFGEEPSSRRYFTEVKHPERERSANDHRIRTTCSIEDLPLKRPIEKPEVQAFSDNPPCREPGVIININPNRSRSPYRQMGAIR